MTAQGAAPLVRPRGQRLVDGNAKQSSALILVRKSIAERPRFYDDLTDDLRKQNPRLGPAAIDRVLGRLIHDRTI